MEGETAAGVTMVTAEDLLARAGEGDRAALKALFEAEAPLLLGLAQRLSRRSGEAERLVAETFADAWRHASAFDPALGTARAWLITILRLSAYRALRENGREMPFEASQPADPDFAERRDAARMAAPVAGSVEALALKQRLEQLAPGERRAVTMAYLDGFSHAEIAERLDVPPNTVKLWAECALLSLSTLGSGSGGGGGDDEDRELLAGLYVLGLLSSIEVGWVEDELEHDRDLARAVVHWQNRLAPLTGAVEALEPAPALWGRVGRAIEGNGEEDPLSLDKAGPERDELARDEPAPPVNLPVPLTEAPLALPRFEKVPQTRARRFKRRIKVAAVAVGLSVAVALALAVSRQGFEQGPGTQRAVLQDEGGRPGFVLAELPDGGLTVEPAPGASIVQGRTLQLWALAEGDEQAYPLGLVSAIERTVIPPGLLPPGDEGLLYQISLEPLEGSSVGRPTGRVVYAGRGPAPEG